MRVRRLVVSAMALALGLSLAGCGQDTTATLHTVHDLSAYGGKAPATPKASAGPDAKKLWDKQLDVYTTCKSVRIVGTITSAKEAATVNAAGACDGSNDKVQLDIGPQSLEVITISGTHYVKANAAFWKTAGASQATINAIGSKYVASKDSSFDETTTKGLLAELKRDSTAGADDLTVEETTLAGQAAYKLVRGARTSASSVTVWASVTTNTLLKVKVEMPTSGAEVTFSEWGSVTPFTAPPASQVITI